MFTVGITVGGGVNVRVSVRVTVAARIRGRVPLVVARKWVMLLWEFYERFWNMDGEHLECFLGPRTNGQSVDDWAQDSRFRVLG